MDLTNASAIVTGGAGGFGSATVRRLAQMGALSTNSATAYAASPVEGGGRVGRVRWLEPFCRAL
jgi:NAD(P)-dependent dehydrogenase (short-subunit alcohol dehydrogenase family)